MLSYLTNLYKKWQRHLQNNAWQREPPPAQWFKPSNEEESTPSEHKANSQADTLSSSLTRNLTAMLKMIGDGNDVKKHRFSFGLDYTLHGALLYIDGLSDETTIRDGILTPLLSRDFAAKGRVGLPGVLAFLKSTALCSGDIIEVFDRQAVARAVIRGDTALFLDGSDHALIITSKGWEKRGISEPQTAAVVRGPRDGFTETLRTNTALLRRRLKTPNLRMEIFTIGRQTETDVCIVYIQDIVSPQLLEALRKRLKAINTDAILDSCYIEQYIEDCPFSLFPTIGASERPDTVAGKILEGRVAIIVDGTPFVLTVPYLFMEGFQDTADYYNPPFYASMIRIVRYTAFFIAVFGPGIFVAFTTFHPGLLPTTLMLTILKAREGTPFPAFIEALILVLAFEIIREAGLRLPRPIGQTISIVGALIMGEAAVSAGLVGAPVVIVVAITVVSAFIIPDTGDPVVILRLIMLAVGSVMGGFGIALGFLALLVHLTSISSFGLPYLSGIAPVKPGYAKDLFVRMPLWSMRERPILLAGKNKTRSKGRIRSTRPHAEDYDDYMEESDESNP